MNKRYLQEQIDQLKNELIDYKRLCRKQEETSKFHAEELKRLVDAVERIAKKFDEHTKEDSKNFEELRRELHRLSIEHKETLAVMKETLSLNRANIERVTDDMDDLKKTINELGKLVAVHVEEDRSRNKVEQALAEQKERLLKYAKWAIASLPVIWAIFVAISKFAVFGVP